MADLKNKGEQAGAAAGRKLGEVAEKAWDRASSLAEQASGTASHVLHKAEDMASNVADKAQHAAAATREKAGEVADSLAAMVRRNPTQTLLAALGIGCLLGLFLARR